MYHIPLVTLYVRVAHLSPEALLRSLHDVKVSQVQMDVEALVTPGRRHVPHHNKGPVLQDGTRRGGAGEDNAVGGGR